MSKARKTASWAQKRNRLKSEKVARRRIESGHEARRRSAGKTRRARKKVAKVGRDKILAMLKLMKGQETVTDLRMSMWDKSASDCTRTRRLKIKMPFKTLTTNKLLKMMVKSKILLQANASALLMMKKKTTSECSNKQL